MGSMLVLPLLLQLCCQFLCMALLAFQLNSIVFTSSLQGHNPLCICLATSGMSAQFTVFSNNCLPILHSIFPPVQLNHQPKIKSNLRNFCGFFLFGQFFLFSHFPIYLIIVPLITQTSEALHSLGNAMISYFLQNLQYFVTIEDKSNISATQPVP